MRNMLKDISGTCFPAKSPDLLETVQSEASRRTQKANQADAMERTRWPATRLCFLRKLFSGQKVRGLSTTILFETMPRGPQSSPVFAPIPKGNKERQEQQKQMVGQLAESADKGCLLLQSMQCNDWPHRPPFGWFWKQRSETKSWSREPVDCVLLLQQEISQHHVPCN